MQEERPCDMEAFHSHSHINGSDCNQMNDEIIVS